MAIIVQPRLIHQAVERERLEAECRMIGATDDEIRSAKNEGIEIGRTSPTIDAHSAIERQLRNLLDRKRRGEN